MILTFWLLITLLLYTYFGYPLLLWCISLFKKGKTKKRTIFPFVSIVIAAYNEADNIENKIRNTLNLDYPKDKLEIIVASDASNDRTDEIVRKFKDIGVKLFRVDERIGKTGVQNRAVERAKGEIIIFSDATTKYEIQVLKKIVRNFADSRVGVVGAELAYVNKDKSNVGEGSGLYWKYERFLKKLESNLSSLIGVSGCCYAVRKKLYEPIKSDLISDYVISQMIYKKGKIAVYEPEAKVYEETNNNARNEFNMRVRVAVRTLYGLWSMRELLNPFKYGFFAIQLISHKILRYIVPFFLIILLFSNIILVIQFKVFIYNLLFTLQSIFYLFAFLGWFLCRAKTPLYVPFYFSVNNFALLVGFLKFLKGEKKIIWKPSRS